MSFASCFGAAERQSTLCVTRPLLCEVQLSLTEQAVATASNVVLCLKLPLQSCLSACLLAYRIVGVSSYIEALSSSQVAQSEMLFTTRLDQRSSQTLSSSPDAVIASSHQLHRITPGSWKNVFGGPALDMASPPAKHGVIGDLWNMFASSRYRVVRCSI
jgi:hypothetical protein